MTKHRFTKALAGVCALVAALISAVPACAQEAPKPGPEFDVLKKLVGTWDATVKIGGQESKATVTYRMGLGDLWLISNFKGEFGGQPFSGHGLDSYDATKKKYVAVWFDSMSTSPMISEGTYDAGTKSLSMSGESVGMDGKPQKTKSVSKMTDDNTIDWTMYMIGKEGKETPWMSITYKRRPATDKK